MKTSLVSSGQLDPQCLAPLKRRRNNNNCKPTNQNHSLSLFVYVSSNAMDSSSPKSQNNTSLQRLQNVEKRIVRVLELAGGVMDELSNPSGPRKELVNNHCGEFMQLIKDIQVTLREEIKSACEYRPFEKCDYIPRISNEICCKKLEYILAQLDGMKQTIDDHHGAA
ncbi:unnamed protein product [Ilex paraguariensis]|uniref:Mediator of RNA polymerase II transcription subunit 11 n=1 Tax=Ilex paraguariensis TaxID=185542 RepID=A0ABC8SI35_9AQUA